MLYDHVECVRSPVLSCVSCKLY